eukprot:scaffold183013_cov20-Prasinocladus_malaysianus.AAC.1
MGRYAEAIAANRQGLARATNETSLFWEVEIFFTLLHMEQFTCTWDQQAARVSGGLPTATLSQTIDFILASLPMHVSFVHTV